MSAKQKLLGYKFNLEISQELKKLSTLDNYHGILAVIQDWLVIIASIAISQSCFYLYPICLLIIGSRQRALSTILHDSAHGRIAENKKLNLLLGTIFSGHWLFQSLLRYKDSHVKQHHMYLGNKNLDPDFQFYIENGLYNPNLKVGEFLLQHVVSTLLLLKVPSYFLYLIKNRISSAKLYPFEFIIMFFCWSLMFLCAYYYHFVNLIILYWIVPFLTAHMVIGYFIEISEHYPYLGTSNEIIHLSRNRFSHWIEDLFFSIHNENYHLVHHLRPGIPFWNMIKAHKVMMLDKEYRIINQKFGGIFFSSNHEKSLIRELISNQFRIIESNIS